MKLIKESIFEFERGKDPKSVLFKTKCQICNCEIPYGDELCGDCENEYYLNNNFEEENHNNHYYYDEGGFSDGFS